MSNFNSDFDSILFETTDSSIVSKSKIVPIVYSNNLSNQLLGLMGARTFDRRKTVSDQMSYGLLDSHLIKAMSELSMMQLSKAIDDNEVTNDDGTLKYYQFKALLNTAEISIINIDKGCIGVKLGLKSESPSKWTNTINLNSDHKNLLILVRSGSAVPNISEDIHNISDFPHDNYLNNVFTRYDLNENNILFVANESYWDMQSGTKLNDSYKESELGDTEYLKLITTDIDENSTKVILSINGEIRVIYNGKVN